MLEEETVRSLTVLLLAALVDYIVGDPWHWLHPVQVMGWAIAAYTRLALRIKTAWIQRLLGVGLTVLLVGGSGAIAAGLVWLGDRLHSIVGLVIAIILLASCFAGRSLRAAAEDVLEPLQQDNSIEARSRLSQYVGRDTDNLSESEILRAVLETVTENAVDAVTSPLFYAIVGALIHPAIAVALPMGYKAASTLDSMVGYRTEPYTHLGWCSARFEDVLTWLPCRLTVLTLALRSGRPLEVLTICRRDAIADPSPNSGWSECIYAAVLGVQVGGENIYRGVVKYKPLLGNPTRPITPQVIQEAIALTRFCVVLWGAIGAVLLIFAKVG